MQHKVEGNALEDSTVCLVSRSPCLARKEHTVTGSASGTSRSVPIARVACSVLKMAYRRPMVAVSPGITVVAGRLSATQLGNLMEVFVLKGITARSRQLHRSRVRPVRLITRPKPQDRRIASPAPVDSIVKGTVTNGRMLIVMPGITVRGQRIHHDRCFNPI